MITQRFSQHRFALKSALLGLAILLATAASTGAQDTDPPRAIEVQIKLTDGVVPVEGLVEIWAYIYADTTGAEGCSPAHMGTGTALWCEQHFAMAQDGVVNLRLGSIRLFPIGLFDTGELYMTFRIPPDVEMTPRQPLASTPFALRAERVAKIDSSADFETDVIRSDAIMDGDVGLADIGIDAVDSLRI